jgi:hypothetical protein
VGIVGTDWFDAGGLVVRVVDRSFVVVVVVVEERQLAPSRHRGGCRLRWPATMRLHRPRARQLALYEQQALRPPLRRFRPAQLLFELLDAMVQPGRVRTRVAVRARRQRQQHRVDRFRFQLVIKAARDPSLFDRAGHGFLPRQHRQHQQHAIPRDCVQV